VHGDKQELISIPGSPPTLVNPPPGCRFAPRCPFAEAVCRAESPPMVEIAPGHMAACHRLDRIEEMRRAASRKETWDRVEAAA
jgi:oligopeptide/dipeptide ABC transporter ATP-binding protein